MPDSTHTTRGESLASRLESEIESMTDEDTGQADVVEEMADAAGIEPSTVNGILNAEITCPPIERLEGFAEVLGASASDLVSAAQQDGCEYDRGPATDAHHRAVTEANIRQSGDEDVVTVQFMTEQVARDGMVLDAEGLDTEAYERNPVVLWSHGTDPRRGGEPIARASNIRQGGDGMLADVTFAEDDFAQRIKRKVQNEFINAVSVGWRTEDVDRTGDAPTVTDSEMTEFSFVAVPADSEALVQERDEGEDLRHRIAILENQLDELRAQATATSPSGDVDDGGTPSPSSESDRDDAQEGGTGSSDEETYVPLSALKKLKTQRGSGWTREDIRTELKKILGMA